jgi:phosphoribosylaminoimidazole-succinocarboxamide synthase
MTHAPSAILETDLPLPNRRQGKVRDVYDCRLRDGREALLIVASDRVSAFDVVMPTPIPGKGELLTKLSVFWFDMIGRVAPSAGLRHHLISTDPADVEGISASQVAMLRGRVMIGRRCRVVPIECVVRGYLAGSGWKEYRASGEVCGVKLPSGLRQCERLPEPIFTPATKAATGHDENISFARACEIVGAELMTTLRDHTLSLYAMAHAHALRRGIIVADTKFEFGIPLDENAATPILIDEALTPDSSRFWPADDYEVGRDQASFDKQYVRNYLQALVDADRWNKEPPGPQLPDDVVNQTLQRYRQAYDALTADGR